MKKIIFFVTFSLMLCLNIQAQDKIKLKTGETVKSRVLGVTNTEVIYYKIFKLKDPKLKLPKSDVEYVQYESGKIVYMSGKNPVATKKAASTTTTTKAKTKKTTTTKKKK